MGQTSTEIDKLSDFRYSLISLAKKKKSPKEQALLYTFYLLIDASFKNLIGICWKKKAKKLPFHLLIVKFFSAASHDLVLIIVMQLK